MGRIVSNAGVGGSMRALLKALGLAICTIVGLVALFEISQNAIGRSAREAANGAAPSPLYASRLEEMQAQFRGEATVQPTRLQSVGERQAFLFPSGLESGCANSACANSACTNSACANSVCGASNCVGSVCPGGCLPSVRGGSGCLGSDCLGSGCTGSACSGSGCAGSACVCACIISGCTSSCVNSSCGQRCSGQAPGDGTTVAGFYGDAAVVPAACPFGSTSDLDPVFVTGFDLERSTGGVRISWISTGADVREFRVLRRSRDGTLESVAVGPATSYRLSHVVVSGAPADAALFLDIVDYTGWTTRVGSDGTTERIAAGGPAAGKERADSAVGRRVL